MDLKKYKPCNQRLGCRACHNGKCVALEDTDFGVCGCPFYKTEAQCRKQENENFDRLSRIGRRDLIRKYNLRRRPDVSQ